jgi:hypothetical protein
MQLFLFSFDYFYTYFHKPAWLACYLGDFITQFFYLRGGGPLVLSIVLVTEYFLLAQIIKRITRSSQSWLWAILPVTIDWALYLKLSYNLSSSVGFIFTLILFQVYLSISKGKILSYILGILISVAGYWMVGSSIFIFPVLAILNDILSNQKSTGKWKILFFIVCLSPYFFLKTYLLPIKELYIFPGTKMQTLALPLGFILVIFLATTFQKIKKYSALLAKTAVPAFFVILIFAGLSRNASFYFEKILSLDSETYFGRPGRVLELANKYQMKSKYACYFTNIALANQNLLPENLLDYYQPGSTGLILPVVPTESREAIVFSNEVFFLLGDMNLAQHSAMLGNIFSPFQRSSRMIKRLAEINLIIGDSVAANKYLRLLDKTLFHRKWAHAHEKMNQSLPNNVWLEQKRSLLPENDTIRQPNDYLGALRYLVEQKPENKIAVDYLLCAQLLNKDLKGFKSDYDKYVKPQKKAVPKIYNEALLIVLYLQNTTREETLGYRISPQKLKDFIEYTRIFDEKKGALEPLEKKFGETYWFYYHFAK